MFEVIHHLQEFNASADSIVSSVSMYGPEAIFISVLFFGETAIFITLLLAQQGIFNVEDAFIFTVLGTLGADFFWFFIGRFFPRKIIPPFIKGIFYTPLNSFFDSFTKDRMFVSIFFLKFFIGIRLAIILYLSRHKILFRRFVLYDILGTLIYITFLMGCSVLLGHFIRDSLPSYHIISSITVGLVIMFVLSHITRHVYKKIQQKRAP